MSSMRIGFVEHEDFQAAKIEKIAVKIILQTPGSRDHDPGAVANRAKLLTFGQSTDHQAGGCELLAAQRVELIDHLHGKLARGDKDERGDSRRVVPQEPFHDGNKKRQRLAGTGLRGGENILAFQCMRNRAGLHRRGYREASSSKPLLQIMRNRKL